MTGVIDIKIGPIGAAFAGEADIERQRVEPLGEVRRQVRHHPLPTARRHAAVLPETAAQQALDAAGVDYRSAGVPVVVRAQRLADDDNAGDERRGRLDLEPQVARPHRGGQHREAMAQYRRAPEGMREAACHRLGVQPRRDCDPVGGGGVGEAQQHRVERLHAAQVDDDRRGGAGGDERLARVGRRQVSKAAARARPRGV